MNLDEHDALIEAIKKHSAIYSLEFSKLSQDKLLSKSFGGLLQQTYDLVNKSYGSSETKISGIKEVWTDDFMEVLLDKTYISKCIHIIRDPRAIAASNYVSGLCYPNLFLARQWRKSAALAKINKSRFPDRYLIVKYEDLEKNDLL